MNNRRALVIVICAFCFFAVLVARLFQIQITKHQDYAYYAENQQEETKIIRAQRGYIYDRNGELLVYDKSDVSYYVDVRMLKEKSRQKIAAKFAEVFGKSKRSYLAKMNGKQKIVCLEEKVGKETALKLKDFVADGFFAKEDPTRVYSFDNLASHLLGYVSDNYEGIEGLEKFYNKELKGKDGQLLIERDVLGRMVTVSEENTFKPIPGNNLYLTIDKNYQKVLEEELKKGVQNFQALSAEGIIMDPNTGEILAMANVPDFNPNCYWKYSNEERRNRIMTDTYEPGSTFKSLTMSILIDRGLYKGHEMIFTENGTYSYKTVKIRDSHKSGWLSVKEVLEQSSNIGMAKIMQKVDENTFYKYLRDYGFGNYTSLDLPGESKGMMKKPTNFNELTKAFMSYGYEVSVTPLQIISAYSALVNGGELYQPYLMKKVANRNGEVQKEVSPMKIRRIINEKTSKKMRDFMVGVVEYGTAKNAKLENVLVGGKTGTSQKLIDNKYSKQNYNSSFVGFFPAENPKLICLVLVNSPQVGRYGGMVAAPIFKEIASRIIASNIELIAGSKPKSGEKFFEEVLKSADINEIEKSEAPSKMASINKKTLNKNYMPDLTNCPMKDAVAVLTQLGLKFKISGKGKVISQSVMPGSRIKHGSEIAVRCESKKLSGVRIN